MYHKLSDPSILRKIYPESDKIKEPLIELQDLQRRKMLFIEYDGFKIINVRFFDKVREIEQWIDRDTISKYLRKNESCQVYWGLDKQRTDDTFWNNIIYHFIFYPDHPNYLKSDVILLESYLEDVWYISSPYEGYNFMISTGF